MLAKLQKDFDTLNNSLDQTLRYMDGLSIEKLFASNSGEWNSAQILNHLMDAEKGTLAYLTKKMQTPKDEIPTGGLPSKIRSILLGRALRNDNKKFKAPPMRSELPERPNYDNVKSEYLEVRKKLGLLLEQFDKTMVGKAYFKHPVAGRITIVQTMEFLKNHHDRHVKQIIERSSM